MDNTASTDLIHSPSTKEVVASSLKKLITKSEKILASDTPFEFIDKAGIDLLELYKNLGWIALNAEIVAKDRDGEPVSLGRDNKCQLMATTIILELAKHIKDKSIVTQVGIFNDPKIVEEANRVLALKNKI